MARQLLPPKGMGADPTSRELLLGIRPEHVTIAAEAAPTPPEEGAGQEGTPATVDIVQPLGDEQIVDLSLKDGT